MPHLRWDFIGLQRAVLYRILSSAGSALVQDAPPQYCQRAALGGLYPAEAQYSLLPAVAPDRKLLCLPGFHRLQLQTQKRAFPDALPQALQEPECGVDCPLAGGAWQRIPELWSFYLWRLWSNAAVINIFFKKVNNKLSQFSQNFQTILCATWQIFQLRAKFSDFYLNFCIKACIVIVFSNVACIHCISTKNAASI